MKLHDVSAFNVCAFEHGRVSSSFILASRKLDACAMHGYAIHHYVIVDYKRTAVRNVLSEYALLPNSYPVSALILSIVPV